MSAAARVLAVLTRPPGAVVVGLLAVTLGYGFFVVPVDRNQGDIARLMYLHVPSAWIAYAAFFVTFAASLRYLLARRPPIERLGVDRLAAASAEVGLMFTGVAILTGMVWGRATWGVWWDWDPRLTTTALLFLLYLAYVLVRGSITDRMRRARLSAVLGVIAFANVPVVHFSVLLWRGLHQVPSVVRPDQPAIAPALLTALLANVAAFTALYLWLTRRRERLERIGDESDALVAAPR